MRKLLIVLFLGLGVLGFNCRAFALPDFTIPAVKTTDSQVKATPGTVYGLVVSYAGVTIGDKIELKNSTDSSGTAIITVVASTANGTVVIPLTVGVIFTTAIFYDATVSGGAFTTTVQYF